MELKLSQKQKLMMSSQLRQAINLLQMGRKELSELLSSELEQNPVLEEEEIAEQDYENIHSSAYEGEDIIQEQEGLISHLMWQLRAEQLTKEQFNICSIIIGSLDNDGYLSLNVDEISELTNSSMEEVETMLQLVQSLDPAGIAARDLKECLLLQLAQMGLSDSLSAKILSEYQNELETGDFAKISKLEKVGLIEIKNAIKEIRKLDPNPGRAFNPEQTQYVVPDIYVRKNGEQVECQLNNQGLPKLKISENYDSQLGHCTGSDEKYLKQCVKSASWLLRTIEQRQNTIFRVTQSIINRQYDFLEKGVEGLKPMILKDIAADCGLHESTISRVTTNKFVHTPRGVFELKYFFSSGLKSIDFASEAVKNKISMLISQENKERPLSDEVIAKKLSLEGVEIARRTVAKYRESLGIESSSKRRK